MYPISWIISNLSIFVTKWNLTLSHFLKYLTYRKTIDCSNLSLWHDYKIFQKLVLASVALAFSPHHNIYYKWAVSFVSFDETDSWLLHLHFRVNTEDLWPLSLLNSTTKSQDREKVKIYCCTSRDCFLYILWQLSTNPFPSDLRFLDLLVRGVMLILDEE